MAKTNSTSTPTKYKGPDFSTLLGEVHACGATISCARQALDVNEAVDKDEMASRARIVIHRCEDALMRLVDLLDTWNAQCGNKAPTAELARG
jgi:hypothetical protein